MQKPEQEQVEMTVEGLLEQLAWASIQLIAWERMATALNAMARDIRTDACKRASYIAMNKRRDMYDTCQETLKAIAAHAYRLEDDDAKR